MAACVCLGTSGLQSNFWSKRLSRYNQMSVKSTPPGTWSGKCWTRGRRNTKFCAISCVDNSQTTDLPSSKLLTCFNFKHRAYPRDPTLENEIPILEGGAVQIRSNLDQVCTSKVATTNDFFGPVRHCPQHGPGDFSLDGGKTSDVVGGRYLEIWREGIQRQPTKYKYMFKSLQAATNASFHGTLPGPGIVR